MRHPPDAESIRNLVPHPRVEQVLLALRLHPIRNRSIASLLRDSVPGVEISETTMLRMTRRFVAAYWLGYSSCAFIDPAQREEDEARLHLAGLIYAFWSLTVIELELAD